MPIITAPGTRILDASGNPVNGGKFRVYTATTTTLASLYSDEGLTTPISNPVEANSAGELPMFFLAAGSYDCAQLDDSDNLLDSQDDVPAWGDETSEIERDFTNSRFKVSGSGGVVSIEAGDPSPDETGGDIRVGGWAGTQADTLNLDGAEVDVSGRLTEQDKKILGVVYTEATTFSAVTTATVPLPEDPTNVRGYMVDIFDLTVSTADSLRLKLAYDGVPTYKAGASDYSYAAFFMNAGSATMTEAASAAFIYGAPTVGASTNRPSWLRLVILTPDSGSNATLIQGQALTWDNSATPIAQRTDLVGAGRGSYGRATHIGLYATGGATLTGKYRVAPLRGFGD